MTIANRQVSVLSTAAVELTSGTAATAGQSYEIAVKNHDGTNPVYVGKSDVTSSTGFRLSAGESMSFSLAGGEKLYARATGGTCVVGVIESVY